jgi:RNA polymerase primary sigma factor
MMEKNQVIPINQDEVQIYLKELRRIKVMTPERERELSATMQNPETPDSEKAGICKELLEGNLRFVITVAKQYQGQGVDFSDLVAEGNIGNEHSRTIRIPVNVIQDLYKEKKRTDKTGERIDDRFANLPSTINLQTQINEDGDTLIDLIVNKDSDMPDEIFNNGEQLKDGLFSIMNILDERERQIIEDYYGISGTPRTLEDIGSDFSLTKERVRQIKEKALRKLRNESVTLFDYM